MTKDKSSTLTITTTRKTYQNRTFKLLKLIFTTQGRQTSYKKNTMGDEFFSLLLQFFFFYLFIYILYGFLFNTHKHYYCIRFEIRLRDVKLYEQTCMR